MCKYHPAFSTLSCCKGFICHRRRITAYTVNTKWYLSVCRRKMLWSVIVCVTASLSLWTEEQTMYRRVNIKLQWGKRKSFIRKAFLNLKTVIFAFMNCSCESSKSGSFVLSEDETIFRGKEFKVTNRVNIDHVKFTKKKPPALSSINTTTPLYCVCLHRCVY